MMADFVLPAFGSHAWKKLMTYRRKELKRKFPKGKVSLHFSYGEFATHDGSPIPVRAIGGLQSLCKDFLEPMRKKFGACTVVSGYRHRRYNASIGGAMNSQHIWDETPTSVAADLRFARGTPKEWAAEARRLRRLRRTISGGGVGQYDRSGFVHVDNRTYDADWHGN